MRGYSIKKHIISFLFFTLELAGFISLIVMGKYEVMGVIIGNVGFWLIYLYIESKMGWSIPIYIRLFVVISILSNGLLGVVLNLYHTTSSFDQIQHAVASYSISIWMYYIFQEIAGVYFTKKIVHFVVILSLAMAFGAFYEIFEFAIDHIIKSKIKNQASLYDTDLDLIANLFGGVLASLHYVLSKKLNSFLFSNLVERHKIT